MWFHFDEYLNVAWNSVLFSGMSLSFEVQHHAVHHACGYLYLDYLLAVHDTFSAAFVALVLDYMTHSAA